MNPLHMDANISFIPKSFAASIARMDGSHIAVDYQVHIQLYFIHEGLLTNWTDKRFLTTVYQHMSSQRALRVE